MEVTTVGKGWFHLHVVPLSPLAKGASNVHWGGGLDLATSTLTLLTRNLRAKSCTGTNFLGLSLLALRTSDGRCCETFHMG